MEHLSPPQSPSTLQKYNAQQQKWNSHSECLPSHPNPKYTNHQPNTHITSSFVSPINNVDFSLLYGSMLYQNPLFWSQQLLLPIQQNQQLQQQQQQQAVQVKHEQLQQQRHQQQQQDIMHKDSLNSSHEMLSSPSQRDDVLTPERDEIVVGKFVKTKNRSRRILGPLQ